MDFGRALAVLKQGGQVRRSGWPAANFISLSPETASRPAQLTEFSFGAGTRLPSAWYPASADLLAQDWAGIDAEDPPPARPGPTRPGDDDEGLLFSFEIRHRVISETGIDRLAALIGGRIAQSLRQQGPARSRQEPRP